MDNGWSEYIEKLFVKWSEACALNNAIHIKASKYYTQWNNRLQLPSLILSTLTTSSLFITLNTTNENNAVWKYIIAAISACASIFLAVNKYYQYDTRSLTHNDAGKSWEKLRIDMETVLVLPRDKRPEGVETLMDFKRKYKELKSMVTVPEILMNDYLKGTRKQIEKYGIEVNSVYDSNEEEKLDLPEDVNNLISPRMNDVLYETKTLRRHKKNKSNQLEIVINHDT